MDSIINLGFVILSLGFLSFGLLGITSEKVFQKQTEMRGKKLSYHSDEESYKYRKYWRNGQMIFVGLIFLAIGIAMFF